jgi:anti-sigma-K factor RskA
MMLADLDIADGRLILRLNIRPPADMAGKSLELWEVPPDGTPRSLGLFPDDKSGTTLVLVLPPEAARSLASGALAVSLEPAGGSTTGLPTGPILFSGAILPVDL